MSSKDNLQIFVTEEEIVILFIDRHDLKAHCSIIVTDGGMTISSNDKHEKNVFLFIFVIEDESFNSFNDSQLLKAKSSIVFTNLELPTLSTICTN